jgi:hypothetical protein
MKTEHYHAIVLLGGGVYGCGKTREKAETEAVTEGTLTPDDISDMIEGQKWHVDDINYENKYAIYGCTREFYEAYFSGGNFEKWEVSEGDIIDIAED